MVGVDGPSIRHNFPLTQNAPPPPAGFELEADVQQDSVPAEPIYAEPIYAENLEHQVHEQFQEHVEADPPPVPSSEVQGDLVVKHSEFAEVVAFANSPISQATSGVLLYNVHIAGIDTAEIKDEIKTLLSEPRLRLDVNKLLKSLKEGELNIQDLTSVKAAYLVKELLHLPIEISYTQKGIFKDA